MPLKDAEKLVNADWSENFKKGRQAYRLGINQLHHI